MSDLTASHAPTAEGKDSGSAPRTISVAAALQTLREGSREAVLAASRQVEAPAGSWILHQGDLTNEVYHIDRGEVSILQKASEREPEKIIADLGEGEWLGEISLIDGGPRTLSARAKTDCSLTVIPPADIAAKPDGAQVLADLKGALGLLVVGRIRTLNVKHIDSLRRELEAARLQKQFGYFFIYVLAIMFIGMLASNAIATGVLDVNVHSLEFVIAFSLILGVPSILVMIVMKVPLSEMGLTTVNLKRSVIEGLVVSAIVCAIVVVAAQIVSAYGELQGNPGEINILGMFFYLLHSFMQELLGRGVLQTSLQKFLNEKTGVAAVFLTAILFGAMHVHLGLLAVGVTFAGGILFGLFYLRHYNLAGVTLVHFFAGAAAFVTGLI